MKLWSENIGGNLHEATNTISGERFWVKWVAIAAMDFTGSNTVVVFVVDDEEYIRLKKKYHAPPLERATS